MKGTTAALCTAGKIILNPSYAEMYRDTQTALCLHAPTKSRKYKAQNTDKPWGGIPAQILPAVSVTVYMELFGKSLHYWDEGATSDLWRHLQSECNGITAIQWR